MGVLQYIPKPSNFVLDLIFFSILAYFIYNPEYMKEQSHNERTFIYILSTSVVVPILLTGILMCVSYLL